MTNKLVLLAMAATMLSGCGKSREQLAADALNLNDADRRREAIVELSRHKWGLEGHFPKAYSYLAQDPVPLVRCAAIGALAKVGDPAYLPTLIKALDDPESKVRAEAADAMDAVRGPSAVEPLCRVAQNDPEPMVRARCARALRHYKDKRALEALIACLDDDNFGVRRAAHGSLCELTGEDAAYEAKDWSRLLAQKEDPFRPPTAKRSWWKL
jgi:HEAT repeat protein